MIHFIKASTHWLSYRLILGILLSVFAAAAFAQHKPTNCHQKSPMSDYNNGEYIGECLNGLANGQGKWRNTKGESYEGTFQKGKRHGTGTFASHLGVIVVSDYWHEDGVNGKAVVTSPDGSGYIGGFSGTDKMYWNPHAGSGSWPGPGVLTFVDGSTFTTFFDGYYSTKNTSPLPEDFLNYFGRYKRGYGILKSYKYNPKGHKVAAKLIGDYYVRQGLFEDGVFVLACTGVEQCNHDMDNNKKRDQAASETREREENRRREAYDRTPAGRAEAQQRQQQQQGRQMCEAQKQTCFASCPQWRNGAVGVQPNNYAAYSCEKDCQKISCN